MYNIEELQVILTALNTLTIQGQSARKMVELQDKIQKNITELKISQQTGTPPPAS